MTTQEFGARLRELRKQAGLGQRELANRIGVNFTYLSKIESGAMPPPSEKVIKRLAEALNVDKDELMALAGRIPGDIAQILKNQKAFQFLRSGRTQRKLRVANRKERVRIMKNLVNYTSIQELLRGHSRQLNKMIENGSFYSLPFVKRCTRIKEIKQFYNKPRGPVGETHLKRTHSN